MIIKEHLHVYLYFFSRLTEGTSFPPKWLNICKFIFHLKYCSNNLKVKHTQWSVAELMFLYWYLVVHVWHCLSILFTHFIICFKVVVHNRLVRCNTCTRNRNRHLPDADKDWIYLLICFLTYLLWRIVKQRWIVICYGVTLSTGALHFCWKSMNQLHCL